MKAIPVIFLALLYVPLPAFSQDQSNVNDILTKLRTELDLQDDQINNITPIIEKYAGEFHDLQQSIDEGTINPSAIDSQIQGIEASETQEMSPYLKPNQLSEWRDMQGQLYQVKENDTDGDDADGRYTNLPNR